VESWGEVKSLPSQWEGERKLGRGEGEAKEKSFLPQPHPVRHSRIKTTKTTCTAG